MFAEETEASRAQLRAQKEALGRQAAEAARERFAGLLEAGFDAARENEPETTQSLYWSEGGLHLYPAARLNLGTPVMPQRLKEPALVRNTWYLEPTLNGVRGIEAPVELVLHQLARELKFPEGAVLTASSEPPIRLMRHLTVQVDAPVFSHAQAELSRRYQLKTSMIVVCGLLAIALAAFGIAGQNRKRRFLELKSDFVSTVSHELRTPLASIRLLSETLQRSGVAGENTELKEYPARIVRVVDGMHFLVENILSFNQVTKGRWVAERKLVRVDDLVDDLRALLTDASTKPVHITLTGGETEIFADPSSMRLLFANLGRNACAYNEQPLVEITVAARATSTEGRGHATIDFSDNGVGIPASEWGNVFHDFYRLKSTSSEVHGSGLGLALCERIMRLHKGSIDIATSGTHGTRFHLRFGRH